MAEYVDIDYPFTAYTDRGQTIETSIRKIMQTNPFLDIPIADVVERKHGKWIGIPHKTVSKRNRTIHSMVYICPLCRYSNGRHKSNFCPNCGADMRGEEDG